MGTVLHVYALACEDLLCVCLRGGLVVWMWTGTVRKSHSVIIQRTLTCAREPPHDEAYRASLSAATSSDGVRAGPSSAVISVNCHNPIQLSPTHKPTMSAPHPSLSTGSASEGTHHPLSHPDSAGHAGDRRLPAFAWPASADPRPLAPTHPTSLSHAGSTRARGDFRRTGGILPLCVDPVTRIPYMLMGMNRAGHASHFFGYVEQGETTQMGAARECEEEAHGVLGSAMDLWRALLLPRFHRRLSARSNAFFVSLGHMDEAARQAVVDRFDAAPVVWAGSQETVRVLFLDARQVRQAVRTAVPHTDATGKIVGVEHAPIPGLSPERGERLRRHLLQWGDSTLCQLFTPGKAPYMDTLLEEGVFEEGWLPLADLPHASDLEVRELLSAMHRTVRRQRVPGEHGARGPARWHRDGGGGGSACGDSASGGDGSGGASASGDGGGSAGASGHGDDGAGGSGGAGSAGGAVVGGCSHSGGTGVVMMCVASTTTTTSTGDLHHPGTQAAVSVGESKWRGGKWLHARRKVEGSSTGHTTKFAA